MGRRILSPHVIYTPNVNSECLFDRDKFFQFFQYNSIIKFGQFDSIYVLSSTSNFLLVCLAGRK